MKMRDWAIFLLIFGFAHAKAQTDFTWWNNIHNWDGVTPWNKLIVFQPGAMGPNALPVPDLRNGQIDTTLSLVLAPEVYLAPGDFTADLFTQINIPLKNIVSLQIWMVPVEYFKTDTAVRDQRYARTKAATGVVVGDVYIGTVIQVLKNYRKWPDLALGINLRTASGNGLPDARATDTPGYFFDLSGGKNINLKNNWLVRPHAMGGFYVYQTNREDYYQNDCFMWGFGADLKNQSWQFSAQLTGYIGYLTPLDTPMVIRAEASKYTNFGRVFFRYQKGNSSYPFTGLRLGTSLTLR